MLSLKKVNASFLLAVSLSSCQENKKMGKPCSGWFQNIKNGHCYRKFCDYQTFDVAQKICENHGGHLPYIRNEQENKFVATLSRSGRTIIELYGVKCLQHHWIGIRLQKAREGGEKTWRYLDGTKVTYFAWQPFEPNNVDGREECVHYAPCFGDWLLWNDLRCDNYGHLNYICEKDSCADIVWEEQ